MKFTVACLSTLSAVLPMVAAVSSRSPIQARQDAAQTSLTLDPTVIAPNFANDGQDPPVAGQVASLTSTNNFINFCVGKTITNGLQLTGGSCDPAPIGDIPSTGNMPSAKFVFPKNGGNVAADTPFTIQVAIKNLITGNFVNAQKSYFAAPQQLQGGTILGHSHVVIELLSALDQTTTTDPNKFAFFKGLNDAAKGGILTTDVTPGLPAGAYRICTINSSSNHQPVIVPIAQHGSLDDCSYFTSGAAAAGGAAAGGAAAGGAAAGGAAAGGAAAGGAAAGGAAAGGAAAGGAAAGGAAAGGAAAGGAAAGGAAGGAAAGGAAAGGAAAGGAAGGNANTGAGNAGNGNQNQNVDPNIALNAANRAKDEENRKNAQQQQAKAEADRAAIAASRKQRRDRVVRLVRPRIL